MIFCRCLLKEAGEDELSKSVSEYIASLSAEIKAQDELYKERLSICSRCDNLRNGMCGKCGCYVEMRAAVKGNRCPSEKKLW